MIFLFLKISSYGKIHVKFEVFVFNLAIWWNFIIEKVDWHFKIVKTKKIVPFVGSIRIFKLNFLQMINTLTHSCIISNVFFFGACFVLLVVKDCCKSQANTNIAHKLGGTSSTYHWPFAYKLCKRACTLHKGAPNKWKLELAFKLIGKHSSFGKSEHCTTFVMNPIYYFIW